MTYIQTQKSPRAEGLSGNANVRDLPGIIQQFRQSMRDAGIHFSGEIIAGGSIHRFHVEGHKRGTKNGAYILHIDGGCPAGWFMDFTTGLSRTWRANESNGRLPLAVYQQIEAAKKARAEELQQLQAVAAEKASSLWKKSDPATSHPYLTRKSIQAHGAGLLNDALVIPIADQSGKLVNVQFISPKGDKHFLSGGRKKGCFHPLGKATDRVLICEGFATGASLFENSGYRTVIAFDSGNLLPVARNIREISPDSEIIICGDNDESGVGQKAATEAALAVDGKIYIPEIVGADWNDVLSGGAS